MQTVLLADLASPKEQEKAKAAMKAVPGNLRHALAPWYSDPPVPIRFLCLKCLTCGAMLTKDGKHWEGCGVKWHPFAEEES